MKSVVVIRQRVTIQPSLPEQTAESLRRGSRLDCAEMAQLRKAAARMVLARRAAR